MRQITKDSINAFLAGNKFNKQNMSVTITALGDAFLYLHGNLIAQKYLQTNAIHISMADWGSVTTRERLTGLLSAINVGYVAQRKGLQYIGLRADDSSTIEIEINTSDWYQVQ